MTRIIVREIDFITYNNICLLNDGSYTYLHPATGTFTAILMEIDFPTSWKTAIIIPVTKPGKVFSDPGSYRPIALTSCLCKTMERMVNSRLTWYLELHMVITEFQSGF